MIRLLRRPSGPPMMAALVLAAGLAGLGAPARAADVTAGAALAEEWCSSCHVVSRVQQQGQSDAPSFVAIARRTADLSPEWLAFRLLTPHPLMPKVSLTRAQAQDLAAYLHSLDTLQD
ncbi:c-type cytochrome [Xanthobacter sp. V4C-4]|uniref:c-type cytochrome n=1 Tax=Xanthobacter cornucopiae TaxID=3119924 RepID=UPI00372BAB02